MAWRNGGRTRTRTWDPLIKSQLLYQLSYAPPMRWGAPDSKAFPVCRYRPGIIVKFIAWGSSPAIVDATPSDDDIAMHMHAHQDAKTEQQG